MQVYLLQLFTGAQTHGVYSDLYLAIAAYRSHCKALQVAPGLVKHISEYYWVAPDNEAITEISITLVTVNAPVLFA